MYEFKQTLSFFPKLALRLLDILPLLGLLWVIGLVFNHPLCLLPALLGLVLIGYCISWERPNLIRPLIWGTIGAEFLCFMFISAPTFDTPNLSCAKLPEISQQGESVHLRNLRDFDYKRGKVSTARYLEEDFALAELHDVTLAVFATSKDGSDATAMLTFCFNDGRRLVFAPEVEMPAGKEYNDFRAHYKKYALRYLFGTEEDFFSFHMNEKREFLFLYPLRADHAQAAQLLKTCLNLAAETAQRAHTYLPFTDQQTTVLTELLRPLCPQLPHRYTLSTRDLPWQLYTHNALAENIAVASASQLDYRCAAGSLVKVGQRSELSEAIRNKLGFPFLARQTEPCVQEEQAIASTPARAPRRSSTSAKEETLFTSTASGAAIPEPRDRLASDTAQHPAQQEETAPPHTEDTPAPAEQASDAGAPQPKDDAAAATRALNESAPEIAAAARSGSNAILEPGERLRADAIRREEEARQADSKDAEQNTAKQASRFNELFFGKRQNAVTIIEKEKEDEEEAHPLDDKKNKKKANFFDEEDRRKAKEAAARAARAAEEDPFAAPAQQRK